MMLKRTLMDSTYLPALLALTMADEGGDAGGGGGADAGAGGEGGAGGADGNGGGEGGGGDGGGADGGASGAWTRPEGLPDNLIGKDANETLTKVAGAYKGLRDKLAAQPGAPKSIEDYGKLAFSEDFVKAHGNLEETDAPVMTLVREKALAAGITTEQFNKFAGPLLEDAFKNGVIEPGIDPKAEMEAAGGEEKYRARIGALDTRVDGLAAQGKLTKQQADELKATYTTASGIGAVEALLALSGERGVETGGGNADSGMSTKEGVKKAMMDERYDSTSPKFDQGYVDSVRAAAKKLGM